jgi:hypothetical protein
MPAFDVYFNGQKVCATGVADGVVSIIVNSVSRRGDQDLHFNPGGLVSDADADEYVYWTRQRELCVGDKIQIEVVDTDSIDEPMERSGAAERLRSRKNTSATS